MSTIWIGSILLAVFCLGIVSVTRAQTGEQNQKYQTTEVIFTAPTEIPGRVLQPGKYLFTLMPGDPEHTMVQVWSANREHLLATILTVPDYHLHSPTGSSTVRFDVNRYGEVDALRAWFFPGDNTATSSFIPRIVRRPLRAVADARSWP